ncbi:penicillin-binding protein [Gabonibacter chumensis]|uniref:penicillin-binding protein n=1 Tax=Gabonibacter chumensis TaxID=2972474 RepID=UPI002572AC44|nr:penicillin-binding protein [Gabonibacter chumensis]MCR9011990.1 transpeptidase family protein [Gabonibacter chumensis]
MSIKHELAGRLGFVYICVMGIAALIVVKALHVQIWEGEKWRSKSRDVSVKDFVVAPNRGDICAADGRVLASSIPYYSLRFDCKAVPDDIFKKKIDSLALKLSRFFKDAPAVEYRSKLWKGKYGAKPNQYLLINRRKVSYNELKELKTFPIFREKGSRSGLIPERENVRLQPHGNLAVRTIGYLNEGNDGTFEGRVGLEEAYENELKGELGRSIRQMMSGRWVSVTVEDPVDGNDVITTIDVDFQDIVQNALDRQMELYDADAGTAILMEVKTGDIKAIANLTKTSKGYREMLNNAIGDAAEPGSVFKAAVMMAILEDGYVHPEDTIDLGDGCYTYYGKTLRESNGKSVGKITVKQIFERSSNGISRLVYENYKNQPEKFINRLYAMQLNKKVGIELLGEGEPYIKYPTDKDWSGISLPWMSIGYEVKLTPLQVLAFYNAIANDGKRMKPRLVKEIRNRGDVVKRFATEVMDRHICSDKTLSALRDMMEGVVENGTAKNLSRAPYKIAGKTGTARVADRSKGYGVRKYRASFVGYFPADDPLYSCIVVVENPSLSKGYYGNVVSGNVFREIADKVYAKASLEFEESEDVPEEFVLPISKNGLKSDFLSIYDEFGFHVDDEPAEESRWVMTTRNDEGFVLKPRSISETLVPNVKGMGLRDALYILENSGLKVGVSGSGTVNKQSLQPGNRVQRGSYVNIELK